MLSHKDLRAVSFIGDLPFLTFTIFKLDIKKQQFKFNAKRTLQFGTMGFFYVAPMLHLNYTKILPAIAPSGVKYEVLKKLAFDQTVFASSMMVGFFVLINILEGNGAQKGLNDVKAKFWTTMYVNWQLWIPASAINFAIMPIKF